MKILIIVFITVLDLVSVKLSNVYCRLSPFNI